MPMERREAADMSKKRFTLLQSDHLAVLNAYTQFDAIERKVCERERECVCASVCVCARESVYVCVCV